MSFFTNTVESIVSDITGKIEKLHAVAEAKHIEAQAHDAVATERIKLASEARSVRDRAKTIAEKFTALISAV